MAARKKVSRKKKSAAKTKKQEKVDPATLINLPGFSSTDDNAATVDPGIEAE